MNLLLDTNVVSEWRQRRPDAGVIARLAAMDEDQIFIIVITIAELRHNVERRQPVPGRNRLDTWLTEQVPLRFEERLMAVDAILPMPWREARRPVISPARWMPSSPRV